jgi:hypothetical protein
MSRTSRPVEGIPAETFAAAVTAAVSQILAAREIQASGNTRFAISPALAQTDVLDYTTGLGAKIFSKATESLPTTFNVIKPNIRILLNELQMRSETYGWKDIMNIDISMPHQMLSPISLLHTHGQCSLTQVQEDSAKYINSDSRKRQNNYQLFVCLNNSVDDQTKRLLANEESLYTTNGPPCGVTYLKLLLQKAEVDTRATASYIRRNLTQLDQYMTREAKNNITKFNEYVNDQLNTLATRGESSNDIIINLLTGYLACSDRKFTEYIEKWRDDYEDGESISYQDLMRKAERKYQARMMNGEWNALSQEQEEIIALKARLASIKAPKHQGEQPNKKHNPTQQGKKSGQRPKQTKEKYHRKTFQGKQSWRNTKPLPHEPKTKEVDGSTWHYCDHHQAWGRHSTDSCLQRPNQQPTPNSNIRAAMAMTTIGVQDVYESENE